MLISKVNYLERGMLGKNIGVLAKIHLIFHKKTISFLRQRLLLSEYRPSLS